MRSNKLTNTKKKTAKLRAALDLALDFEAFNAGTVIAIRKWIHDNQTNFDLEEEGRRQLALILETCDLIYDRYVDKPLPIPESGESSDSTTDELSEEVSE